jgi:hypothetical protein
VQDMYSPGGARANLWLKEASSTWFENIIVPAGCPDVQSAYTAFAYRGLFNCRNSAVEAWWSSDRQQRHGYGASYLLKYHSDLSSVTNDPFAATMWQAIRNGGTEVGAIQAALGSSLPAWWTQFSKAFFTGRINASCYPNWASFHISPQIKDEKSADQSFPIDAYPLSSISWSLDLVRFTTASPYETAILAEGLKGGQTVYLYDVKTKKDLAELTEASPRFEIDDLNKFAGSVIVLVFVDANLPTGMDPNYQSSTNKVTLRLGGDLLRCYAKYVVSSTKAQWSGSSSYEICGPGGGCHVYWGSVSELFLGEITNEQYRADAMWCPEPPGPCRWKELANVANSMTFRLTPNGNQPRGFLEEFQLRISFTNGYDGTTFTEGLAFTGKLPRIAVSPGGFHYRLTGAGVCSASHTGGNPKFLEIGCDANSYIEVVCDTPPKP